MSDSDNQDETLSEFTNVTGIAADRAKFYLESANWNLQVIKNNRIILIQLTDFCKSVCNMCVCGGMDNGQLHFMY